MDEDRKPTTRSGDEDLLREIRDRYKYASDAWEEIRKERQKDMRYICGNPWEDTDRKAVLIQVRSGHSTVLLVSRVRSSIWGPNSALAVHFRTVRR